MASVQNRTGRRTMMFRLVAACGCAVLAACRAAATPYACKLSNVDMNGSADLPRSAGGAFRVRDEAACLTRCQRNSACTAITWFRSAPSHALWNCYLKNPSDASKPLPRGGFDMFFMSSSSAACKSTDESRQTMISDRRAQPLFWLDVANMQYMDVLACWFLARVCKRDQYLPAMLHSTAWPSC